MTPRTRSSAHFAVVDAIAQGNHRRCSSFGNGKVGSCSGASVWMRPLRRQGGSFHRLTGRSRRTRAWSTPGVAVGATAINDPINTAAMSSDTWRRPIRSDCQSRGTMDGALRSSYGAGETVREDFATSDARVPASGWKTTLYPPCGYGARSHEPWKAMKTPSR